MKRTPLQHGRAYRFDRRRISIADQRRRATRNWSIASCCFTFVSFAMLFLGGFLHDMGGMYWEALTSWVVMGVSFVCAILCLGMAEDARA